MWQRLHLALSVLALTSASVSANEGIEILEVGLYEATTVYTDGTVNTVRNPQLLRATSAVPAQLGTRFGLRYRLQGSSLASRVIKMTFVTKYLGTGLDSDQVQTFSEYSVSVPVGTSGYREFQFDDARELLPGKWTFEFWLSDRKLAEQEFCVFIQSLQDGVTCNELNS